MRTVFDIMKDVKESKLISQTNLLHATSRSSATYTDLDLHEHLKLTFDIVLQDICGHWKSYEKKFGGAAEASTRGRKEARRARGADKENEAGSCNPCSPATATNLSDLKLKELKKVNLKSYKSGPSSKPLGSTYQVLSQSVAQNSAHMIGEGCSSQDIGSGSILEVRVMPAKESGNRNSVTDDDGRGYNSSQISQNS